MESTVATPPLQTERSAITQDAFRGVLSRFASGVTVVTTRAGGVPHGLTISAFLSVSASPPLIAVAIDREHRAHELLARGAAAFAVNILADHQQSISDRFAWVKDQDRFALGRWTTATTGAPVLEDAAAWLDCEVFGRHEAGSHVLYLGHVVDAWAPEAAAPPLLYWHRTYRRLADLPDPANRADVSETSATDGAP